MLDLSSISLYPGSWVTNAQAALDRLAECATLDDVTAEFGSARDIAIATLGYPINGGHATKPVIRAFGQLLHHRLGPAVACEALALATTVGDLIDSHTVELLLEQASTARTANAPLRISEAEIFRELLVGQPTIRHRRELVLTRWNDNHRCSEVLESWETQWLLGGGPVSDPYHWSHPNSENYEAFWLELLETFDQERLAANERFVDGVWARDPSSIAALLEEQPAEVLIRLARHPALFELDDEALAVVANAQPWLFFRHPCCPQEVLDHLAAAPSFETLALALRAEWSGGYGKAFYSRFRQALAGLTDSQQLELVRIGVGARLVHELTRFGLLSADMLCGPFATIWPSKESLWWVLPINNWAAAEPFVNSLLERHPDPTFVAWLLSELPATIDGERPLLSPHIVERMLDHPNSSVRDASHTHAEVSQDLPASRRPRWNRRRDDQDAWRQSQTDRYGFFYEDRMRSMDGRDLIGHQGWTITLPRDGQALRRNAKTMRNCTAGYANHIAVGDAVLLIITSPQGERFNASIHMEGRQWHVGEVNAYQNDWHRVPAWLSGAIARTVEAAFAVAFAVVTPAPEPPVPPIRHPKPRRKVGGGLRSVPSRVRA